MKIYIAGPLFNELELKRNQELRDVLSDLGFDTYLPQKDGGISYNIISAGGDSQETRTIIFKKDTEEIQKCDIMLCLLDGRVPDEGMCVELGIGFALKKICIGYSTDKRSFDIYGPSLIIEGCLTKIVHNLEELKLVLSEYK